MLLHNCDNVKYFRLLRGNDFFYESVNYRLALIHMSLECILLIPIYYKPVDK